MWLVSGYRLAGCGFCWLVLVSVGRFAFFPLLGGMVPSLALCLLRWAAYFFGGRFIIFVERLAFFVERLAFFFELFLGQRSFLLLYRSRVGSF